MATNQEAGPSSADQSTGEAQELPKDGKVIASILRQMGIVDYEPLVVDQLLEFTYKYVNDVLDDARVYAEHAGRHSIDSTDIDLAIDMQNGSKFGHPPREVLLGIASEKNSVALPPVKAGGSLRLPPDRYCLLNPNYRLRSNKTVLVAKPKFNPAMLANQAPERPQVPQPRPFPGVQPHPLIQQQQQLQRQRMLMQQAQQGQHPQGMGMGQQPQGIGMPIFVSAPAGQEYKPQLQPMVPQPSAPVGKGLFRVVTSEPASQSRKRKAEDFGDDFDD